MRLTRRVATLILIILVTVLGLLASGPRPELGTALSCVRQQSTDPPICTER